MTAWLDKILGRVTMYALVIIALGAILAVSVVLSALGYLAFSPIALIVSAAVLFAASYLANGVLGLIFRIRPQLSSTAITALLLVFIVNPSLDLASLAIMALAAVVAVISKYLLAVRGRHIFNPAAAGAFVAGIVLYSAGLDTFISWWVGTGPLLPFVALGALAVLFRTRHLPLGGVAVLVYVVGVAIVAAAGGQSVVGAAQTAFLSSPIVFFAGFMLSEPLTLPPRRRQQLAEAALVGALYAAPIYLLVGGTFLEPVLTPTPQLALLIGNALAFALGQRRGIRLVYRGKRQLTPTAWEFEFEPKARVAFIPGQYMELTLPHPGTDARGWRRVFSIASAPGDGSRVRFGIRLPEESSSFKRALLALQPGSKVSGTSVAGDFVLPKDTTRSLLLVAGGIGITPYVGHLEHLRETGDSRDVALVYAVSSGDDLAYAAELERADCRVTVVSPTRPAALPADWTWVEADRITGEALLAAVPDAAAREAFLSGPPALVASLRSALRGAGARRVHTDVFVGY